MNLTIELLTLHLKSPLQTAHGTITKRTNVLVHLGEGLGEGALPPYYDIAPNTAIDYLKRLDPIVLLGHDPLAIEDALDRLPAGPAPARAAFDIALHDHWARQLGHPLYRLWGLNPALTPHSIFTLGIPKNKDQLLQEVRAATDYPILKLKLGTGNLEKDEELIRTLREATEAHLCIDANGIWSISQAAQIIPRLVAYDLLFIEQPLRARNADDWHRLRHMLPDGMPPLIADESVSNIEDILPLAGAVDGINIKLSKAGGLREARRMITLARTLDMLVMLGCMVESTVALTAAAHLSPLVDYADLDGALHLANDPFEGMRLDKGQVILPKSPGLGITPRVETNLNH